MNLNDKMSVDTKKMREWAQGCAITGWVTNVSLMCDEIDRLREQVKSMTQDAAEWAARVAPEKNELLRLRDQLRPRSIKDEPPPRSEYVLACAKNTAVWLDYWNPGDGFEWWLPMPPAPPQPDAFEEWMRDYNDKLLSEHNVMPQWNHCRDAWDAALASVKKGE